MEDKDLKVILWISYAVYLSGIILFFWGCNEYSLFSEEYSFWESIKGLGLTLFGSFIIICIGFGLTMYIAAQKTVRTAKKAAKAVGDAAEKAFEYIVDVITGVIDAFAIESVVQQKVPNAFKLELQEKKKNAVNVGIFINDEEQIAEMTLSSDDGISDDLYEGQIIYL